MINFAKILSLIFTCSFFIACPDAEPVETTIDPEKEAASDVAFRLTEKDLIPEGMCYDPVEDCFYIGSIRKAKILKISMDGEVETFVSSGHGGIQGVIGVRVDPERRILWANTTADPYVEGHDPERAQMTGVLKFNLEDGNLVDSYTIERGEERITFNDLALGPDGNAYITTYSYGVIFKVDIETNELTEYLKLPEGAKPNGIDTSPDKKYLFISAGKTIYRVTIATGQILPLASADGVDVTPADGMYFYDNSLVGITYRLEGEKAISRVVRWHLSEDLTAILRTEILDDDHELYSAPTTGAIVDDTLFYIGATNLDGFDENAQLAPMDELSDIIILKLKLD